MSIGDNRCFDPLSGNNRSTITYYFISFLEGKKKTYFDDLLKRIFPADARRFSQRGEVVIIVI